MYMKFLETAARAGRFCDNRRTGTGILSATPVLEQVRPTLPLMKDCQLSVVRGQLFKPVFNHSCDCYKTTDY